MKYSDTEALQEWKRIPIDDFGYFSAEDLLILSTEQRQLLVEFAGNIRFNTRHWRNRDNCLVEFMVPSATLSGKRVLDYGCGFGLDSILLAKHGASVVAADINPASLMVVLQNASLCGCVIECLLTSLGEPFFNRNGFDLFWSFGVLHHTPKIGDILRRACDSLNPGGECRIGVYSDKRFKAMTSGITTDIDDVFVRKCDAVGHYADWYDQDKLSKVVDGFAEITEVKYICEDNMLAAVIRPKGK